jgi:hypothetical protein
LCRDAAREHLLKELGVVTLSDVWVTPAQGNKHMSPEKLEKVGKDILDSPDEIYAARRLAIEFREVDGWNVFSQSALAVS